MIDCKKRNQKKINLYLLKKQVLHYTTHLNSTATEWVTFVHGAGGSSSIWFKQLRAFSKHFNVLAVDLRGHGNSKSESNKNITYTFDLVTKDIVEVMDFLKIEKSHFVGISLGTILIRNLTKNFPKKVLTIAMGGAIMKMNFRTQVLMRLGVWFKSVIPYMFLYKLFAFIIMPRKNHKQSRFLFGKEAKKMNQEEFIKWFRLTSEINPLLRFFRKKNSTIPTLYVMGEQDYLFLPSIRKIVLNSQKSTLQIIPNCGHVVNIENATYFNKVVINFIKNYKMNKS